MVNYNVEAMRENYANRFACVSGDAGTQLAACRTWLTKRLEKIDEVMDATSELLEEAKQQCPSIATFTKLSKTRIVDNDGYVHAWYVYYDPELVELTNHSVMFFQIAIDDQVIAEAYSKSEDAIHWIEDDPHWKWPRGQEVFITYLRLMDELASIQSYYNEYLSECCDSVELGGSISQAALTHGMLSSDDSVREVASQLACSGAVGAVGLLNLIRTATSGLSDLMNKSDPDGDAGYQFNVNEYKETGTMNMLSGVWTLISSATSLVGTIAMVAGHPVVSGIAMAASALCSAVQWGKEKYAEATSLTFGSGSSDAYAVALKTAFRTYNHRGYDSLPLQHQASIHLPWGHILFSNPTFYYEEDAAHTPMYWEEVKALVYPSCYSIPFSPLGLDPAYNTQNLRWGRIGYASDADYMAWLESSSAALEASLEAKGVPTTVSQVYENVTANLGSLAWWLAILSCNKTPPVGTVVPERFTYCPKAMDYGSAPFFLDPDTIDPATAGLFKRILSSTAVASSTDSDALRCATYLCASLCKQSGAFYENYRNVGFMKDGQNYFPYCHYSVSSDSSKLADMQDFMWNKGWYYSSQSAEPFEQDNFLAMVALAYNFLTHCSTTDDTPYAVDVLHACVYWDGPLYDRLTYNMGQLINGRSTRRIQPADDSEPTVGVVDFCANYDDNPRVIDDPLVTPPAIDGRSFILAAAITIGTVLITLTAAFIIRRKVRRARRVKCLEREQEAIAAQDAYKENPNDDTLRSYMRAQKRFTRYANKVGYSSNNVGSFNSTTTSMDAVNKVLEATSPAEQANDPQLSALKALISGSFD